MPFGTITATESTFGSISGSIVGAVPGTLSGSVGVPGPQGPQGIQGIQGPPGPAGPGSTWGGIAGTISDQTDLWTQLGLKAPLAGPVFTGDARAVTPTFGDNDTSIATTAFVQSALQGGTAIARNLEVEVRNQSGVTVPAGSIVYISGATGNKPLITLAQANNDANSAQTIGFVKTSIANNGTGYVIVRGELENIDTSALAEGVQLYLSPTTAGTWTTTKPSAPQHLVYVGIVIRSHPTQGVILVAVQNGYELNELHDVQITSPTDGQVLKYNSSTSLWYNGTDVAPVTSVAGRTGAITLSNTDISGLGTMSTASASNYSTTAVADTLYAPIAAGLPTGGTVGQVLTKNSGTNYEASFATLIPGDRYVTTSSTSLTIGTGTKSLTIGTGLAYTPNQDVTVSYTSDPTLHHMHGPVTSYNSGTGALVMEVQSFEGSGTYSNWVVNVGGTVPLETVEWGEVLGVLGDQSDLATALNSKLELSGGVLTVNATIEASTATTSTLFAGDVFGVQLNANPSENASLQYNGLLVQNAVGTMSVTPAGLTFPNSSTQTVAYPGSSGFLLKADNLTGLADTAVSRTNLGLGTMATATAADYSTTVVADGLYYPLSGNPSSFLVSADIAGKANLSGATFTGLVNTLASSTAGAGFRLPHGAAPTTPTDGDVWSTTGGLFWRQNAATKQAMNLGDTQTVSGNITFSNANLTLGNSTAAGTINVGTGATISGSTKAINIGTAGVSGSTTNITVGPVAGTSTTNIGNTTAASTLNLATGATLTATTKAVNIGTSGVAGSTTNITIGSTTGTSTTTLQGTTNGVTAAADTNSVALATTAYVVGQAGSATPLVDGTAAVGTSLRYARQDHVHPSDTTRLATANNLSELTATASTARTNIGLGTISTVNDAPSDGSTYGRNNGAWVVAGGGGGSGADVQTFTTAGTATWTKPAGKTMALIRLFGGAGGGGAGGRYATSSARAGGAAGQVGGMVEVVIPLASLGATETVTVGAGGNGGTSATIDTTAGGAGSAGGNTTFWNLIARGGAGGVGGTTATASQVSAASSFFSVMGMRDGTAVVGGNGSANGAPNAGANITINFLGPTGAAGGVGQSASVLTSAAGGAGGSKVSLSTASGYNVTMAGGAGGTTGGVAATAGTSGVAMMIGGTGGGGGAYRTGVAGMAGGAGGQPSGAGAGGSASDNGFNSGAGGKGGDGMVVVVCY